MASDLWIEQFLFKKSEFKMAEPKSDSKNLLILKSSIFYVQGFLEFFF